MVNTPIPEQYLSLFNGLGTFPESYEIKLKQEAQPFALFTPRSVPLPLRKKVEQELARMESLNVISRVDEPTVIQSIPVCSRVCFPSITRSWPRVWPTLHTHF